MRFYVCNCQAQNSRSNLFPHSQYDLEDPKKVNELSILLDTCFYEIIEGAKKC